MGLRKSTWYLWTGKAALWDNGNDPGSLTAGGAGYQQAATWLLGANMQSSGCLDLTGKLQNIFHCIDIGGTYVMNLARPHGYQGEVVWYVKALPGSGIDWTATSTYAVPHGLTQYLDLSGNVHRVVNSQVTVGASPILLQNKRILGKDGVFDPRLDSSSGDDDPVFKR